MEMEVLEAPALSVHMRVSDADARLSFLAMRCWQDAMIVDDQHDEALSLRLENIIDEFDTLFGT